MIKVLHVVSDLGSGGVENLLYNYYVNFKKDEIIFDFIVHSKICGKIEKKFIDLGSKVYHVTPKGANVLKNITQIRSIIKHNDYDIIHAHQDHMSFVPLYFAKKYLIKTRISHSHLANISGNNSSKKLINIFKYLTKRFATEYFACSRAAGVELFGNENVVILNNAIHLEKFSFNIEIRNKMRCELNLDGKFVIGNVGRLVYQKNHLFLIDIFSEIKKKNSNAVLLLIGEGDEREKIEYQINKLELKDSVYMLGEREDIADFLNCMDVFLFPTRFEGLGIVLIEAQANGLHCITSAEVVPIETKVTNNIKYVSLEETPEFWADKTLEENYNDCVRLDNYGEIKNLGFDIHEQATWLEEFYLNKFNRSINQNEK